MKNAVFFLCAILCFLLSCSSDEKPIDILLNAPKGALLVTMREGSDQFILSDLESSFNVEVRASDQKRGEFFNFVRVYIIFQDNISDGATSSQEMVLTEIPRSEFYIGEFGFPRTAISVTFQEALDALNIDVSEIDTGDQFFIRPEMHLKDGRTIGFENRSPSIIADFCENSPFYYQVNVVSPINDAFYTGTYSYEVVSSSNLDASPESGVTTITNGEYPNQRRSAFLDFTVAGDLILPDIYQERGGLCRVGSNIAFWGPQENSFGTLSNEDDSVFFADFIIGYDGWVGGDLTGEPITVRYKFSKQ